MRSLIIINSLEPFNPLYIHHRKKMKEFYSQFISKGDYISGYLDIADSIRNISEFSPIINKYFYRLSETMEDWCELTEGIVE